MAVARDKRSRRTIYRLGKRNQGCERVADRCVASPPSFIASPGCGCQTADEQWGSSCASRPKPSGLLRKHPASHQQCWSASADCPRSVQNKQEPPGIVRPVAAASASEPGPCAKTGRHPPSAGPHICGGTIAHCQPATAGFPAGITKA